MKRRVQTLDEYINENLSSAESGVNSTGAFIGTTKLSTDIGPGEYYVNTVNGYDINGNPHWQLSDPEFKPMTIVEIFNDKELLDKIVVACEQHKIPCDITSTEDLPDIIKELISKTGNKGLDFTILDKDTLDIAKENFETNEGFKMGLKTHEKFYEDIVQIIQKHRKTVNRDDMLDALKVIINEVGTGLHD